MWNIQEITQLRLPVNMLEIPPVEVAPVRSCCQILLRTSSVQFNTEQLNEEGVSHCVQLVSY
jgi:hypothetical protein